MATFKPKFQKPNLDYASASATGIASAQSGIVTERLNELEQETELAAKFNPYGDMAIDSQRKQLPVFRHRQEFLYALETHRVVIVIGETGSGKSTQLPQYLLESGWTDSRRMICVTEPRRIAAINLAKRVCDERSCFLGSQVGYAIRFEDCFEPGVTRIKFLTDGLLIREMMQNPLLPQYSVVVVDEVHERNVNTDIILGLLKKIMRKRADLKLVVCSATVNAEEMKLYFDQGEKQHHHAASTSFPTAILSVEGRYFPIEISYLTEPCDNYLKASVTTAFAIHLTQEEHDGDILVFLTGQDEVDEAVSTLIERAVELKQTKTAKKVKKLLVLPLYGSLPVAEQMKCFERTVSPHVRKIIVATNIAETSLTIPGILFVVDCGFMKLKAYDPRIGSESLITVAISKSSADQRAGRAGRYRSGKAYRMFTESQYNELRPFTPAEMQRCDLSQVIIQLKALGIDNICRFEFLSPPPSANLVNTLEFLHALQILDHNARLTTPLGFEVAEFPLHPTHAKALLNADTFKCTREMLSIVAMLQVQHVFVTPSGRKQAADRAKLKFACVEGDHLTLLNVYKTFAAKANSQQKGLSQWCANNFLNYRSLQRAMQIRAQLSALLRKFKRNVELTCEDRVDCVLRCLASAFFANAARAHYAGDYRHLKSSETLLRVHPSSVINLYLANVDKPPPRYVIYNDVVQSKTSSLMREISVVECKWLQELANEYYEFGTERELRDSKRQKTTE